VAAGVRLGAIRSVGESSYGGSIGGVDFYYAPSVLNFAWAPGSGTQYTFMANVTFAVVQ
jgi:hypothetical protein